MTIETTEETIERRAQALAPLTPDNRLRIEGAKAITASDKEAGMVYGHFDEDGTLHLEGSFLKLDFKNVSFPEGMVLVPREPTEKMIKAGWNIDDPDRGYHDGMPPEETWQAMLTAAEIGK